MYKLNTSKEPKTSNAIINEDGFCIGDCETCSIDDCDEQPANYI
jgi:hypothetical protein